VYMKFQKPFFVLGISTVTYMIEISPLYALPSLYRYDENIQN